MFRRSEIPTVTIRKVLIATALCLALAACDSAEERAEAYFSSAQDLIAAGDVDRAMIELRNVFELVPEHEEARRTMARLMLERDNRPGAYGQYLRLSELRPEDLEANTVLAELAFGAREWEAFSRHGERARELDPEAPRSRAIGLALEYRAAVLDDDTPGADAAAERAETMLAELPDSDLLEQIVLDGYMRAGDAERALAQLDAMIARQPGMRRYYDQRLMLLRGTDDRAAMKAHLRQAVAAFPDDTDAKSMLVQYLVANEDLDEAEAFLREISDPADPDPVFFISLVQFLAEVRGPDAARAELDAALDVSPAPERLRIIRAALDFEDGQRDAAIADLQALLAQPEPPDLASEIRITLARMLQQTGDTDGARQLVDAVLEADAGNVSALKMRAERLIAADDTNAAIADLRRALDSAPEDVQALSLMAEAHARAGSHDLARDFHAQAVDVSGSAPGPALRYARVLIDAGNDAAAEEVLLSALRRSPEDTEMLSLLGQVSFGMENFERASVAVAQLRRVGTPEAEAAANRLQVALLERREGTAEALSFIEDMAADAGAGFGEKVALVRARLASGEQDAALALAEELAAEAPADIGPRLLLATTRAANGDFDAAISDLRAILAEDPAQVDAWRQLYSILRITGAPDAASAALDDALAARPDAPALLWLRATELEENGAIDDAIAVYEDLYARDSGTVIFANNLASLLATYRDDAESLDRAWTIARRLRGTEVPAFQDTYGWLAFRRGDAETALPYLESAAAALQRDPIVQYHLAEVYAALDRTGDAIAAYAEALDVAGADDTRPQIASARQELERLQGTVPGDRDNQ